MLDNLRIKCIQKLTLEMSLGPMIRKSYQSCYVDDRTSVHDVQFIVYLYPILVYSEKSEVLLKH